MRNETLLNSDCGGGGSIFMLTGWLQFAEQPPMSISKLASPELAGVAVKVNVSDDVPVGIDGAQLKSLTPKTVQLGPTGENVKLGPLIKLNITGMPLLAAILSMVTSTVSG